LTWVAVWIPRWHVGSADTPAVLANRRPVPGYWYCHPPTVNRIPWTVGDGMAAARLSSVRPRHPSWTRTWECRSEQLEGDGSCQLESLPGPWAPGQVAAAADLSFFQEMLRTYSDAAAGQSKPCRLDTADLRSDPRPPPMLACPEELETYGAPEVQKAVGPVVVGLVVVVPVAVVPARRRGRTELERAIVPGLGEPAASQSGVAALGLPCRQGLAEYRSGAR
jgi:hypothetical protein